MRLRDVTLFPVHRARIRDDLFLQVRREMIAGINNYGIPTDHENEESRSRYLAPVCFRRSNLAVPVSGLQFLTRSCKVDYLHRRPVQAANPEHAGVDDGRPARYKGPYRVPFPRVRRDPPALHRSQIPLSWRQRAAERSRTGYCRSRRFVPQPPPFLSQ